MRTRILKTGGGFVRGLLVSLLAGSWLLFPAAAHAVSPPPAGEVMPFHVQQAQKELARMYGSNRIAQRIQDIKAERLARGVSGADATGTQTLGQRIPILLGNYSNVSHLFTSGAYLGHLFGTAPPGVHNFRSYFTEISSGQFLPTGSSFGPYTAPGTQAFYVNGDNGFGNDFPTNAGGFVLETVRNADTNSGVFFPGGVNFGTFDNDGPDGVPNSGDDDGFVDGVLIIVPDGDASDGDADNMWAHQGNLNFSAGGAYTTNDARSGGGFIQINEYTIQGGEKGNGNLNVIKPIGVMVHEWGHILGLPDLYDVDNSTLGIGTWGLMGLGSWGANWNNTSDSLPTHMCAWSKVDLGWEIPTVVTSLDSVGIQLGTVYKLWEDAWQGGRYFLVELRDKAGFDAMIPSEGLLVWHCNDDVFYDNRDDNFRLVDLEEADGLNHLDTKANWMDMGDMYPWGAGSFNDGTNPNSKDVLGASTGVGVNGYAMGPGPTIFTELIPRTLNGFTVSYTKHAFLSSWGFSSAQTNNGAVRYVAPEAGDLVQVLFGAHEETAENYTVRIFDNMNTSNPASPIPVAPYSTTAGSIPSYNTARYHEIVLSASHSVAAGDTFLVDVASGPDNFTVPALYRAPHSGNSWFSSNGAANSYFVWTDKDVAMRARLDFVSAVCPVAQTGDVNLSTTLTSGDIIYLVNYVFKSGVDPLPCIAAGDVNCSVSVTSADIIYMVNHVFKSGALPCDVCSLIPGSWSCP